MRFDSVGIFGLRYPTGDESLIEICRIAALNDGSMQVNSLVGQLNAINTGREIVIDGLSPDDDVPSHFRKYRPDLLLLNCDMLDEVYIKELTARLAELLTKMPAIVTIGSGSREIERLLTEYSARMHIQTPMNPITAADRLKKFILHDVVSVEYYRDKLKQAAELTLTTLGAQKDSPALPFLVEAALIVLENPFVHIGDIDMIYREISKHIGVTVPRLKRVCRPELKRMLEEMSDYTYELTFREYVTREIVPTETELIYAAARLTSTACERLLSFMREKPLTVPRSRVKIYSE